VSVTQLDSRDHLLLALLVGAPLAAVTTLNGLSPVCNARTAAAACALRANGRPPPGGGQLRRGSQLKNRRASASPATPQAATTSTSVQWKAVPRNAACIPSAKCLTGKIRAIHRTHCGVLLPNEMNIPSRGANIPGRGDRYGRQTTASR